MVVCLIVLGKFAIHLTSFIRKKAMQAESTTFEIAAFAECVDPYAAGSTSFKMATPRLGDITATDEYRLELAEGVLLNDVLKALCDMGEAAELTLVCVMTTMADRFKYSYTRMQNPPSRLHALMTGCRAVVTSLAPLKVPDFGSVMDLGKSVQGRADESIHIGGYSDRGAYIEEQLRQR